MTLKRTMAVAVLAAALLIAVTGVASYAQQSTPDIWQLAPSNSLLVVAFDTRHDNSSMRAMENAQDSQTRELWRNQRADMHKALESFATLFGISLDFAEDIASWDDQQCAFALLPDGERDVQPVYIMASKDSKAANALLQKILQPMKSVGNVESEPDTDYPITTFITKDKSTRVFASASGPLIAFSLSKPALKTALKAEGFAAGSNGEKAFRALAGSMIYAYGDPALLKLVTGPGDKKDPMLAGVSTALGNGAAMGVSVIDTGFKIRILGFPSQNGSTFIKQMVGPQQQGVLTANPAIPSGSLAVASLPNIGGVTAFAGVAMSQSPMVELLQAISTTPISAALTAALPMPAGVASAMASSEQDATDKLNKILNAAKQLKMKTAPATPIPGVQATAITVPGGPTLYLTQVSKYILLASDAQALASARATIGGEQPGIADSKTYKETMAGLDDSNILTVYTNLAPVQGLGFLISAAGLSQMTPFYDDIAKSLENTKALGIGVGLSDQAISATIFLRAKPELRPSYASFSSLVAVQAAVLFPVFARAREQARAAMDMSNMKELTLAAHMYADEHDGRLPTTAWRNQVRPYMKREAQSPSENVAYAYNKNLSGVNYQKIVNPSDVVIFFEAYPGVDSASRADAILPHGGQGIFAYVDGHVNRLAYVPDRSNWIPKVPTAKPAKKAAAKPTFVPAGSYIARIGTPNDSKYLQGWSHREISVFWGDHDAMRWSTPGSNLILPIKPGRAYQIKLDVHIPSYALMPGAGVYLGSKQIIPFKKTGNLVLTGIVPPVKSSSVELAVKSKYWSPSVLWPGVVDSRTLGVSVRSVTVTPK